MFESFVIGMVIVAAAFMTAAVIVELIKRG